MLLFSMTVGADTTERASVERLIERIASGDRAALQALYEQTHEALYAYALSVVKHTHDAQDVLHDCYMTVAEHAADYRRQGKPMAWIYTIARNRCMQVYRDRAKADALPEEDWRTTADAVETFTAEDRIVLTACMEQLTDEERQIVLLHAVSGLRHREIAALLSMNLSTVLSKYHRSLKKLKDILEGGDRFER